MVKGITIIRKTSTPAVFDRLTHFFSAMGLESGRGWDDDLSRGAPFLAPLGNLELVDGMVSAPADVLVEVTALEDVRAVAEAWVRNNFSADQWEKVLSPITATDWRSRIFKVEPVPGIPFAFWESDILFMANQRRSKETFRQLA
jgi:6,7-dimethyl-8-ribityllumazine synthase